MVVLYVNREQIGTMADEENWFTRLAGTPDKIEIRNEKGCTLGWLIPSKFPPEPLCPWEPDLTREEIDRRCREPGGSTLAEILKRLGAE